MDDYGSIYNSIFGGIDGGSSGGIPGPQGPGPTTFIPTSFGTGAVVDSSNSFSFTEGASAQIISMETLNGNSQGLYFQFSPTTVLPAGVEMNFSIQTVGGSGSYYTISLDGSTFFTGDTNGDFNGGGSFSANDIFAIYSDGTTVFGYQNGTQIASAPYNADNGIWMADTGPVGFLSVPFKVEQAIYYPTGQKGSTGETGATGATGAQGSPGATFTTLEVVAGPSVIVDPISFNLVATSSMQSVGFVETFNGGIIGLFYQQAVPNPSISDSFLMSLSNEAGTVQYQIVFTPSTWTLNSIGTVSGWVGAGTFTGGDLFSIYMNSSGSGVIALQNGNQIGTSGNYRSETYSGYTIASVLINSYSFTNVRFYPIAL